MTVLWGMTEGGLTTCHADSPKEKFRSTCGTGLPGLELHTIDREGGTLPADAEGELLMRGPGVFFGYLGQDELYAHLDRGRLLPHRRSRHGGSRRLVRITGRVKDLIIRGGVNISPVPIEDALAAHPNIASVAVIGSPDERMGERLCAVIEPRGRQPELSELQDFVRQRGLPKYLAPGYCASSSDAAHARRRDPQGRPAAHGQTPTPGDPCREGPDRRYRRRLHRAGDGPPVVLVHGLAEDRSSWAGCRSALRAIAAMPMICAGTAKRRSATAMAARPTGG